MGGMQYLHTPGQPQSSPHPSSASPQHSQHGAVSFSPVPHQSGAPHSTMYNAYTSPSPSRSPQQPPREEPQKHVAGPMFIHHAAPLPSRYVIHQAAVEVRLLSFLMYKCVRNKNGLFCLQHSRSSPHKFPDDGPKYYPPPTHGLGLRTPSHLSIHPGLTIQPNPVKSVSNG